MFDDALGMRPSTAYIWSSTVLHLAGSWASERWLANSAMVRASVRNYDPNSPTDKNLIENPKGVHPFGRGPDSVSESKEFQHLTTLSTESKEALAVVFSDKVEAGLFSKIPGAIHTGASAANFPGVTGSYVRNVPALWYGTLYGTCHQAANTTLLESGLSNTMSEITRNWTTRVTDITYGTYGGGIPRSAVSIGTERTEDE